MNTNNWREEFDRAFNRDEPNGKALVLLISNSDGSRSQAPAQHIAIAFISTLIEQVREETKKDIREKLKELPVGTFDSTPYLEKFINTNLK